MRSGANYTSATLSECTPRRLLSIDTGKFTCAPLFASHLLAAVG
jgi:hypothetical protein